MGLVSRCGGVYVKIDSTNESLQSPEKEFLDRDLKLIQDSGGK